MTTPVGDIVLCFECGAKNRLCPGWTGAPVCAKCGMRLPVEPRPAPNARPAPTSPAATLSPTRPHSPLGVFWAGVAVAAIAFLWFAGHQEKRASPASSAFSPPPGDAPAFLAYLPVYVSTGLLYNNTGKPLLAPLKIKTAVGSDYFIKLIDIRHNNSDAVGLYAHGGLSQEFLVPLGLYELRYASGKIWYGMQYLFGPGTRYAKVDETLFFTQPGHGYEGYTVELSMLVDGNLRTSVLEASEF
jgi:hypothetical protein